MKLPHNMLNLSLFFLLSVKLTTCFCQAPPTTEQVLSGLGIKLDRASLISALGDARPSARSQAAAELANTRVIEAVPEIEEALKRERQEKVIYSFALSLDELGSSEGTKRLEGYCANRTAPIYIRMGAADALANHNNYACISAMTDYLSSSDEGERESALLYLAQIPSFQDNEPRTLGPALLTIATSDPNQPFRTLASKVIEQIGDPTTKDALLKHRQEDPN